MASRNTDTVIRFCPFLFLQYDRKSFGIFIIETFQSERKICGTESDRWRMRLVQQAMFG